MVTAFATGTFATAGAPATPIVIAGELPGVDEADAVVINETAADELDLGIGSALTFRTASPARMLEWVNNDGQFDSEAALDGPTIDVHVATVTRTDGDLEAAFPAVVFSEGFAAPTATRSPTPRRTSTSASIRTASMRSPPTSGQSSSRTGWRWFRRHPSGRRSSRASMSG